MLRKLLFGLLLSPAVMAQNTFVWTDESGRRHYSDQPPPPSVKAQQKSFKPGGADAVPPFAVRKAAQQFPVLIYTGESCTTFCEQARKLLQERGVPFTEKKVASKDDMEQLTQRFDGNGIVPSIEVGSLRFPGFAEDKWHSMLDEAGYPKSLQGLSH